MDTVRINLNYSGSIFVFWCPSRVPRAASHWPVSQSTGSRLSQSRRFIKERAKSVFWFWCPSCVPRAVSHWPVSQSTGSCLSQPRRCRKERAELINQQLRKAMERNPCLLIGHGSSWSVVSLDEGSCNFFKLQFGLGIVWFAFFFISLLASVLPCPLIEIYDPAVNRKQREELPALTPPLCISLAPAGPALPHETLIEIFDAAVNSEQREELPGLTPDTKHCFALSYIYLLGSGRPCPAPWDSDWDLWCSCK